MKDSKILKTQSDIFKITKYQKWSNKFILPVNNIKFFKDCNHVIDIGCNSGIYSLVASRYAQKITGVEGDSNYFKRTLKMQKYFRNSEYLSNFYDANRVKFVCEKFGNFDLPEDENVDGVIICNIAYHFSKQEVDSLSNLLHNAKKVLMQLRVKGAPNVNNNLKLQEINGAKKYLKNLGFNIILKQHHMCPILLGKKS